MRECDKQLMCEVLMRRVCVHTRNSTKPSDGGRVQIRGWVMEGNGSWWVTNFSPPYDGSCR